MLNKCLIGYLPITEPIKPPLPIQIPQETP